LKKEADHNKLWSVYHSHMAEAQKGEIDATTALSRIFPRVFVLDFDPTTKKESVVISHLANAVTLLLQIVRPADEVRCPAPTLSPRAEAELQS
jgi:hypothetical protein